ncbi:MAG: carbamoyl-phosphate synthase large subunit [bacterium]|nr:carbamoyl-phosphate synthase large subunit [bacterium]
MPRRTDLKTILIIGPGPIVIGQACEFDYSGTQAVKALKELGYRTILINSNPATIMTDPELADRTYVEPITADTVAAVIAKERPDALLPTMGGQTALNVTVELAESGVLEKYGVELIGAKLEAIRKAESRELFKDAMVRLGLDIPRGGFARTLDEAMALIPVTGYPAIIRPSFTLGGTGGSIAYNVEEYRERIERGLKASPVSEVLVEESCIGWKEYELEVMRDLKDNVVIICSIENVDPMGVHTGDSITVAPVQTLTDREYERMRDAAKAIIREIGVETGGSNIQFAVDPRTGRMIVIEMNPRVSRSSALASKATGFPIAKIAARLAVGLTLDEIPNDITGKTPASFEPSIDYVVVKIPRWNFEKFPQADPLLGTQMKSVGETMAIGRTFKEALQKAFRSLETGRSGFDLPGLDTVPTEELLDRLARPSAERVFEVGEALRRGVPVPGLYAATGIDPWFLNQMKEITDAEAAVKPSGAAGSSSVSAGAPDAEGLRRLKRMGFSDRRLARLSGRDEAEIRKQRRAAGIRPAYKIVDTCAAEFESETSYLYGTYDGENEGRRHDRPKALILGSGPNRIGQGIEFDYCCVHAVMALREAGYETLMLNNNPETVSTDYDTSDKLYFDPLALEDVLEIHDFEKPDGVIVQFGGQTPLRLAKRLEKEGVRILGTSPESIDLAEDRERFGSLVRGTDIRLPEWGTAFTFEEARKIAASIGYPVLVRPSYVLGGRAMEIVYDDASLEKYIRVAAQVSPDHPVLVDRFLEDAFEFDVDAVRDGKETLICGLMQHIEEAGIHSGDSSCVLPPYMIDSDQRRIIVEQTKRMADMLDVRGLINVQFAMRDGEIFVLEVNPRASRTVPFVSKATGIPWAKVAARVIIGQTLKELGIREAPDPGYVAVKTPVFPFAKFPGTRTYLGPEMRSTGEVMGVDRSFGAAFAKAQLAAGNRLPVKGGVFISVNDNDKPAAVAIGRQLHDMGFRIYATEGTYRAFRKAGVPARALHKVEEGRPNSVDGIINREIDLIMNTPLGKTARADEYNIGRTAIAYGVPFLTTLSAAWAAVQAIRTLQAGALGIHALQDGGS